MGDTMNFFKTNFKLSRPQLRFLLILLLLGIILSFIIYKKIDQSLYIDDIKNISSSLTTNHINFIFTHFIVTSVLLVSSFMYIGLILFLFYFLFEITCISYSLIAFTSVFSLPGFFYGILYNLIIKLFFLICLVIIFKNIITIIKRVRKNKEEINIKKELKIIFTCFLSITIYDLFLYFFASFLLNKLTFIVS